VLAPVLVENEEQLLGAPKGKHGHENTTAPVQDARDGLHQGLFSLETGHMGRHAIGRFGDQDINLDALGHLGRHQMSILFARVVAREEDVEAGNLNEKHGGPQHMAGRIRGDANRRDGVGGVVVDSLDLGKRVEMVLLRVNGL
jgi:hypothetical protein